LSKYNKEILFYAENQLKYRGYIEREQEMAEKMQRLDRVVLPDDFAYDEAHSISAEAREKLKKIKPRTIGQASRISGVSPSDISVLLVMCGR
jgi:tRNA uridine 5-carboxymethylaminomethyl modification enzyme